jgi:hypothetical protein
MQEFERLYRLYTAKRITRNQFKAKTGLTVNGWAAKKKKPTNWFDGIVVPPLKNAADNAWFNDTAEYVNNQVNSGQMSEDNAKKFFENSMSIYGIK